MRRVSTLAILLLLVLCQLASAGDLYKVRVQNQSEAEQLVRTGVDPIIEISQGYLVLTDETTVAVLRNSGLEMQLIVDGITKDELALDRYPDDRNESKYDLLFAEDDIRIYRVDPDTRTADNQVPDLFSIGPVQPEIRYVAPRAAAEPPDLSMLDVDLWWLVSQVKADSLESYVWSLQTYFDRVAGTYPNEQAREWIIDKFGSFGYDSVVVDSFVEYIGGSLADCQNVVAYKTGTLYPNHYVVVGGHRDAVPGSPGADDNGSGAAGVLEVARILQDVETDLSFVFVLFDAEEWGLYGSYHYVSEAVLSEDSIVYMLNMDMIADDNNYNFANVYHGAETARTDLWAHLADSLVNVYTEYNGTSTRSDHYPFQAAGFEVTFVQEYTFSSVYHTPQDSIRYCDFDYSAKLVKASLATCYVVSQTTVPPPKLAFAYPGGVPNMLLPQRPTSFNVQAEGILYGQPVPGSGQLHYCVNDDIWNTVPLTESSPGQYVATIPGQECLSTVKFYVSAEEATSGEFVDPGPIAPFWAHVATSANVLWEDDFETDQNWITTWITANQGRWERAVPVNDPGDGRDPLTDSDGSGKCYVTDNNADTDVDEGTVLLWTPHLDMTTGAWIEYDYYLNLSRSGDGVDRMAVQLSDYSSEVNWIEVASHEISGGNVWMHHEITQADLVAAGIEPTYKMRMRFVVNDSDPQSAVEAGIDAFKLTVYECSVVECCGQYTGGYTGNADFDIEGKRNLADISKLIDRVYLSKNPLECEDNGNVDGDLENKVNLSDISRLIDHVYISKEETASCP